MLLIVAGIAVYKFVQLVDSLLPKEPMPWVKLLASICCGYAAAVIVGMEDIALAGLAVATVAGATHTLLRLLTLAGDYAQRKSIR